jgi:hypothetical protein
MKTLLFVSTLACTALSVHAQGVVYFQNRDLASGISSPIYMLTVGGVALDGTDTNFRAALLGGPAGTAAASIPGSRTNNNQFGLVPSQGSLITLASPSTGATWTTFRTGAGAGFVGLGTDSARPVPGQDWGTTAEVQVVAWNGAFDTWPEAYAAWFSGQPGIFIGASNPLNLTLSSASTDPNITKLIGLESFAIVPAPEPSTLALAGLSAAALMIFRRRN